MAGRTIRSPDRGCRWRGGSGIMIVIVLCLCNAEPSVSQSVSESCSNDQPCSNATLCCSSSGFCGNSEEYCGVSNCLSGPCFTSSTPEPPNSPTCGVQANGSFCPDNLCCSQHGFCGNTADYCGSLCQNGPCGYVSPSSRLSGGAYAGIAVAVVAAISAAALAILFFYRRRHKGQNEDPKPHAKSEFVPELEIKILPFIQDHDSFYQSVGAQPKLYREASKLSLRSRLSYETLYSATNAFNEELGRGGFGVVYKGTLKSGTDIAVKKLLANDRGLKDFEAEVKTLGSINHANLVALLGYCYEQNQPFLVYEYVPNGSLDKWIFQDDNKSDSEKVQLPWKNRVDIVTGTAKGLAYLHEDLQIGQAIIHMDIKPENILLTETFGAKVADFGMAKLLGPKRTETMASGGTIGYMAPEVYVGSASTRMDVYSFGIVLLEVLSGRKLIDRSRPRDEMYLPAWVMRKVTEGNGVEDIIDPRLEKLGDVDWVVAQRLVSVGLLCLQRDPDERPPMSNVLRMMEGNTILLQLPRTLQQELELTERLSCNELATVLPAVQSSCLIDFSTSEDIAYNGNDGAGHIAARGRVHDSSERPTLFRPSFLGAGGFDPHFLSMTEEESIDTAVDQR